ncbi:MAG: sucrase ferredoxin [Acidimicrobiia bacterium]
MPELAEVVRVAAADGVRVLLVARERRVDNLVVCFYRTTNPATNFSGYEGTERRCTKAEVPTAALAMLGGESGAAVDSTTELIVCTHGRRDICCGSLGMSLYQSAADAAPPGVRVWRSSHQGGHRYAATALVLPEGTAWAHLDLDSAMAIVRRTRSVLELIAHYRGCVGIDEPRVQALEAIAFAEIGWPWLAHARRGSVGAASLVQLDGVSATSEALRWLGVVRSIERLGPACGEPLGDASERYDEWVVQSYRRCRANPGMTGATT